MDSDDKSLGLNKAKRDYLLQQLQLLGVSEEQTNEPDL